MKASEVVLFALLCMLSAQAKSELISTNIVNGDVVSRGGGWYERPGITNSFSLPAGKQLIVHAVNGYPANSTWASYCFLRKVISAKEYVEIYTWGYGNGGTSRWNGPIVGPMDLQIGVTVSPTLWAGNPAEFPQTNCNFLLEIKDDPLQATSSFSANISSASVVVPSNAVGDVDVLLEQSNDMITWTQCLPGTYNASTQKRFFRVRAVEK
jgi:hypothetical protein